MASAAALMSLSAAAAAPPTPTSSSSSSSPAPRLTLRLGLPGSESPDRDRHEDVAAALSLGPLSATPTKAAAATSKRAFLDSPSSAAARTGEGKAPPAAPPAAKAQVVGWPPVRNYRKNTLAATASKSKAAGEVTASGGGPVYVKVSMDGAPYLSCNLNYAHSPAAPRSLEQTGQNK